MYMMEQVCRQIRFWMDEYGAEISVSVNQSKLLFYQDGYVEKLCEIIERYHVPAHLITLEILEGMALEDQGVFTILSLPSSTWPEASLTR